MRTFFILVCVVLVAPCAAQDVVVLKRGEVTAQKLWVGAWANVTYRDASGKQTSANGEIRQIYRGALTIGKGFWSERIAFDQIEVLVIGKRAKDVKRSIHSTKLNEGGRKRGGHRNASFVATQLLISGALEVGGALVGGKVGGALYDGPDHGSELYFPPSVLRGVSVGMILGSALGTIAAGAGKFQKPIWARALLGSSVGFSLALLGADHSDAGFLWPLFIAPPVCSTLACWMGNELKDQYGTVQFGLLKNGGQAVSLRWHF